MKFVGFGKSVTVTACFESLIPHTWLCVGFLLPNSCRKIYSEVILGKSPWKLMHFSSERANIF